MNEGSSKPTDFFEKILQPAQAKLRHENSDPDFLLGVYFVLQFVASFFADHDYYKYADLEEGDIVIENNESLFRLYQQFSAAVTILYLGAARQLLKLPRTAFLEFEVNGLVRNFFSVLESPARESFLFHRLRQLRIYVSDNGVMRLMSEDHIQASLRSAVKILRIEPSEFLKGMEFGLDVAVRGFEIIFASPTFVPEPGLANDLMDINGLIRIVDLAVKRVLKWRSEFWGKITHWPYDLKRAANIDAVDQLAIQYPKLI